MDEKNASGSTSAANDSTARTQRKTKALEFLMFVFFVAKTLSDTVIVNLLEKSVCLVELGYNESSCEDGAQGVVSEAVQQRTATLVMIRSMVDTFFPSLLSLFIGPWSDTNGRLPLILIALASYTVSSAMWCIFSLFPGVHPLFFLLTSIPVAIGGGCVTFFMAVYCYVSDTTEPSGRALRMSLLEAASLGGILVSSIGTPYLLKSSTKYGFAAVFATSASLLFVTFLYTNFCLTESITIVQSERKKLWRKDHVKEVFATCFKSRPNHVRTIVMLLVANLAIFILIFDGELKVLYMFSQCKFSWDLVDYTQFVSFVLILAGISVVGSTWFFMSVLKLAELPVLFLCTLGLVCKSFVQAIAASSTFLYVSSCFLVLTSIIMPLTRAQVSKLIPSDELGKIFAFTAFVEATAPLAAAPLYFSLFKVAMDTEPNAVFWLSTGLSCVCFLIVGLAMVFHRLSFSLNEPGLDPLLAEDEDREENAQVENALPRAEHAMPQSENDLPKA